MDPLLLRQAYLNLALAIKAVVDIGEESDVDAKVVAELLTKEEYLREKVQDPLTEVIYKLRNRW